MATTKRVKGKKTGARKGIKTRIISHKGDIFPIEKGIERNTGAHRELTLKVLRSMLAMKERNDSFFVKEGDKKKLEAVRNLVTYLKHKYKKDFNNRQFSTSSIYDKGELKGLRVWLD